MNNTSVRQINISLSLVIIHIFHRFDILRPWQTASTDPGLMHMPKEVYKKHNLVQKNSLFIKNPSVDNTGGICHIE